MAAEPRLLQVQPDSAAARLIVVIGDVSDEGCGAIRRASPGTPVLIAKDFAAAGLALARGTPERETRLESVGLVVDLTAMTVHFRGIEVALSPRELSIVAALLASRGIPITRKQLHERVWQTMWLGDGSHIDSAMQRLRRKLSQAGIPKADQPQPVRGLGFRMGRSR